MSIAPTTSADSPKSLLPTFVAPDSEMQMPASALKRFSVDEYHAMIDAGVFGEDKNFELLDGLIVRKMTINPPHWIATGNLRDLLVSLRIPGVFIHSQEPVTTDAASEPEPDVAVIRGVRRDYISRNPDPNQTPLVVEVADSTLMQDRTWKKRIYATAAVPVYWIVNLVDRQIEVFTQPSGPSEQPAYANCEMIPADGEVPVIIDGREVGRLAVKEILP